MGSFESSEMGIVAYGRSCAEAIFGSPGCHLFNTSHLGDLVACVERETAVCVLRAVIVVLVVVPPSSTF
jgi:hypothetical protein